MKEIVINIKNDEIIEILKKGLGVDDKQLSYSILSTALGSINKDELSETESKIIVDELFHAGKNMFDNEELEVIKALENYIKKLGEETNEN